MSRPVLDLNADLGEDCGDDEAMLEVVTSANVSTGAHAGTPDGIARTLAAAAARSVVVGAHVAYPDRENFGRTDVDLPHAHLVDLVVEQVGWLRDVAASEGTTVQYVKPHGALYNRIVRDRAQADAVVEAILALDATLGLLCLPDSQAHAAARDAGLATFDEVFADRSYQPTGELTPRTVAGAVLHDGDLIAARVLRMATHGEVEAVDGTVLRVAPHSVCVHGDTPGAVGMARAVAARLRAAGVRIVSPFPGAR
ncbi:MAG: LamB/YcsF family protein [Nocardioides sp.]|uniref:LamB/YcsF family protein n=1 Tax=Nocardioides sp. TaxID=35761 RepID=UPI003F03D666